MPNLRISDYFHVAECKEYIRVGVFHYCISGENMNSKLLIVWCCILLITVTFNIGCSTKNEKNLSLDRIEVDNIKIDGWEYHRIWCNWTEDTNESIFKPNEGEYWYAGAKLSDLHNPDPSLFDSKIRIVCYNDQDRPLKNVDINISGCGVSYSGLTNSRGEVFLSLEGCHLEPPAINGCIRIEASFNNLNGTIQKEIISITVLAGDTHPNQGI